MSVRIDPKVDFVFKKLFASPENVDLLIDFLNSVLCLPRPVATAEVVNPFNEKEFEGDKLSVVDVKAADALGRRFQVEIQLQAHVALPERILYTWARVFTEQLGAGVDYSALRPTYAIWLLDDVLLPSARAHHHGFVLQDPVDGVQLGEHLAIHLIELPKWSAAMEALTPEDRWIYFFKDASAWDELPGVLGDSTMQKAMDVLKNISQRERDMAAYESRMDQLRVQRIYEAQAREFERVKAELERERAELERARAERDQERAERDQERAERGQERAELARLKARLQALGLEP